MIGVDQSSVASLPKPTRWIVFRRYFELIRFSHTIFALPFALLASFWAWTVPVEAQELNSTSFVEGIGFRFRDLVGLLVCMVSARSFAMAFNRLADAEIDAHNPRTATRHLPAKLLDRGQVVMFTIACALLFIVGCLLFLPNWLPLILSVPVLLFLATYSFTKRFTALAHYWLGMSLSLAPICAWIAVRGQVIQHDPADILPAVSLGLVVLFWVGGFDIIYACQDYESDRKQGLYSIPSILGIRRALWVARLSHLAMWLLAFSMTDYLPQLSLGWIFRVALLAIGVLLIYEHSVVSERSLAKVQLAFFHLNSIISVVFLVFGILDSYLP